MYKWYKSERDKLSRSKEFMSGGIQGSEQVPPRTLHLILLLPSLWRLRSKRKVCWSEFWPSSTPGTAGPGKSRFVSWTQENIVNIKICCWSVNVMLCYNMKCYVIPVSVRVWRPTTIVYMEEFLYIEQCWFTPCLTNICGYPDLILFHLVSVSLTHTPKINLRQTS